VNYFTELQPDSLVSYLVAFLFPVIDAVFPVFPSESAIVTLGVATAKSIDPRLVVLVVVAALGACVGDNICFFMGRYFGPWLDRHSFKSDRGIRRRAWAQKNLERFGGRLIFVCRFVPGGRTAVTFSCGMMEYQWRRFLPLSALSGAIWASYAFAIGRIGGSAFAGKPWLGLVVALGLAVAVGLVVEAVRRIVQWRRRAIA
jgi:membrane-associated protein